MSEGVFSGGPSKKSPKVLATDLIMGHCNQLWMSVVEYCNKSKDRVKNKNFLSPMPNKEKTEIIAIPNLEKNS